MLSEKVEELSHRVDALEKALASAHRDMAVIARTAQRALRARTVAAAVAAVVTVAALATERTVFTRDEGQTITAPFLVVNSAGQRMFQVREEDGLNVAALYGKTQKPVAAMAETREGGALVGWNSSAKAVVALGAGDAGDGALILWDRGHQKLADLLRGADGNQGLGVYSTKGELKAEVIGTSDNLGAMSVRMNDRPVGTLFADVDNTYLSLRDSGNSMIALVGQETHDDVDASGQPKTVQMRGLTVYNHESNPALVVEEDADANGRVKVFAKDGKGAASAIFAATGDGGTIVLGDHDGAPRVNVNGTNGLQLLGGAGGRMTIAHLHGQFNGSLELATADGQNVVEAGALSDGRGIVRAGPAYGGPIGIPGLPPAIEGHLPH